MLYIGMPHEHFQLGVFAGPSKPSTSNPTQLVGFEDAQLRNEEAVKRHFCLSCVAQSALQEASCSGQKSERFDES
jgi:hypothetical protein